MGMLVSGVWQDEDPPTVGSDGSFVRPESGFRGRVTCDGSSGFKAEAGRYYLVTAPSCPWAHRTVLMRKLKGLEDAIPILQSDLPKGQGWAHSRGFDDLRPIDCVFHVHQVHSAARPGFTGRATVPVLSNYTRDIYQMPGVPETVDIPRIKLGYYGGMRNLNPSGIIALGPELDFSVPHDRGRLAKAA
jgi:putative glutathione S-transferase